MPLPSGIIQMARVNMYFTNISITNILPAVPTAICGDDVEFFVSVTSSNPYSDVNDGYFAIIEVGSEIIIGTGTISSGIGSTGLISGISGNITVYAKYYGLSNLYYSSISAQETYTVLPQRSTISITDPIYGYIYCYYNPVSITATVAGISSGIPSGNVLFKLYLDTTNYIELPTGTINPITGEATIEMPAMTGDLDGYEKYIQATYEGSNCYYRSSTNSGLYGTQIIPISEDTTYVTITSMAGPPYPISNPITFTATVAADSLSPPDGYDGYVKFKYRNSFGGPYTDLGISYLDEGEASLTIPGYTFPGIGVWIVGADFYSESQCYASTTSTSTTTISIS